MLIIILDANLKEIFYALNWAVLYGELIMQEYLGIQELTANEIEYVSGGGF